MKDAESKTTSSSLHPKKEENSRPFFRKEGEGGFFSEVEANGRKAASNPLSSTNITSFFSPSTIQPKLTIGQPGDKYEQEADATADKVVQRLSIKDTVQAKCNDCEEEDTLQKKMDGGEEMKEQEEGIQTKSISASNHGAPNISTLKNRGNQLKSHAINEASPDLENRLNSSKGSGRSLSDNTRSSMESVFGTDFSNVNIHTGSQAVQMNQDLGAQAFTHGSDVFFNRGKYRPETTEGQRLLGHELTHVVQQGGASQVNHNIQSKSKRSNKRSDFGKAASDLMPPASGVSENSSIFRKEIESFRGSSTGKPTVNNSAPQIQKVDVLENDMSTVPNGMTCPVSNEQLTDPGASLEITFNRGGTVLMQEDIDNIAVFVNRWHDAALSVPVRIHGYASKDGRPPFNWPLSCRRSEAVATQMQKVQPAVNLSTGKAIAAGRPGIPAGFVQKFAHGETEEFSKTALLPNRRAMVHIPALPSLPGKIAKAPTAKLKTGPTYTPNGNIPVTKTKISKNAPFRFTAEFEHDPANGILASCGEIRQYIKWSSNVVDPGRVKGAEHEGFLSDKTYTPDTWYEDRHQENFRYGHRRGPHQFNGGTVNQYLDAKGAVTDFLTGPIYKGRDKPNIGGGAAFIAAWLGTWEFKITAIDVCNDNKVLGQDNLKIVW